MPSEQMLKAMQRLQDQVRKKKENREDKRHDFQVHKKGASEASGHAELLTAFGEKELSQPARLQRWRKLDPRRKMLRALPRTRPVRKPPMLRIRMQPQMRRMSLRM